MGCGILCTTIFAQSAAFTSAEASTTPSDRTCFAHEKHVQMMGLQKYAAEAERIEQHTAQWAPIVAQQRAANQNAVVTIPVVFHVVYRTATENISAEQIQSQLDVLNDDFRRLNSDVDDIWPQAADTEIEFCLASFDPQGNPTDGILRVSTTVNGFGTNDAVKSASSGGSDAWPYNQYLNFWVCNIGGGILGYAQFPGGSASTDGVVCGYQYTGTTGTATSPFDLGRTATHEVGHWLNLRHIWGDGGCGASDFVDDTPDSDGPNYGCALGNVACNTTDMVQNYMDYSDDACMNLFTQGQTDRMLALFQPGGFRAGLLESNGCAPACEVSCGCTDDAACNFDANALNDDGSCDFSCYGCTDATACNYNADATIDDNSCIAGGPQTFTMNLTPDNYGSETTWSLVDASGATVMSGGPYTNNNSTPITVSEQLCYGCYTLTVNDSYGDGMCCTYGNGSYSFSVAGEVVASGATFTTSDVSNFCAEPTNVDGCTDISACNYNPSATTDDGSCLTEDACGICGGPGDIYECGCADIPAGDCDCNGNQLDECGECGGGGIPAGDCDCNGNQLDALGVCGGSCTADADSDGICDDVDTCVGTLDECGVCNGPGIPEGDCDCNGNQLDALDVCGGTCTADADNDGICDDVDDCVGTVDECGVCNGPGIPAGDCDCNGNQLDALDICGGDCTADADSDGVCDDVDDCVGTEDALGVCNGDCTADADQDGICDDVDDCVGQLDALGVCNGDCAADVDADGVCDTDEVPGCDNEAACNYDVNATDNDGSCVFVGDACNDGNAQTLGDVYTNCDLPNFGCQGVGPEVIWKETFGDEPSLNYGWNGSTNSAANETEWSITFGNTTDYFYTLLANDGDTLFRGRDTDANCTWTTRNIDVSTFTELKLSAELSEIGGLENADFVRIDAIVDGQTTELVNLFNDFNTVLVDLVDVPDGDNIQIQITVRTDRNGEYISFDDVYLYGTPNCADSDGDGLCDEDDNCSDLSACNFSDPSATECLFNDIIGDCGGDCTADADSDGICDDVDDCIGTLDACGICNGPGAIYDCGCSDIPTGDCDCDGNQDDVLGVCGGDCTADADSDGICDDVDDCVGTPDACGVCNGPGEIFECGCADIPAGDCDCDGNQVDALGECGGSCSADADQDGICDDVDDCVGSLDACGVCNGPGAIFDCGCTEIPAGDCDCDGNQDDAIGDCGGDCTADADSDGICDDVDNCIGTLDACGICNGPGEIYDCGCSDIPTGDCDCDGNQDDVLGVCGGDCTADADSDGICDDVDDCVGTPDACGVCNGPGEIFECGCADIPTGDCDCDGNQVDALGECGGSCSADADQDGICDDVDDCVGSLDACGVCNGPGAIYDCGCTEIPAGDCDCDGNQLDAIDVCGGDCAADADQDGICDDVDDCVGDLDACGICNGPGAIYDCGCSDIPTGDCDCDGNQLDAIGVCGGTCTADVDGDGVCDNNEVPGCTDETACNYNPAATDNDGTCLTNDVCGVCGGPGDIYDCGCTEIPAGDCDCDGNQLDALGNCGGDCSADADQDGICDDVDDCVGTLDACGVCNGPGDIYDCGCTEIPAGDCDCDGNQLDALNECGGDCAADADQDGICDDVDDCVGDLDACGICNGPGDIYDCGCSDIPEGDCDCDGNQLDALDECGGDCAADADQDGICDDVDDCVGTLDACGVCNGPGAIYECGCSDIPTGDCDCDGNQQDAAGVCGGDCTSDIDGDGVCDTDEVPGCDDPLADNYDSNATDNDGSCTYLPASFDGLVAEAYELNSVEQGTHTFRVYAQFSNPNDQLISVYGTESNPISVSTTTTFYQDEMGGPTAEGTNELLFGGFPNLEWDSYVTIGSDNQNISGFNSIGMDYSTFNAGGALTSNPTAGGSWFVFPDQEPTAFPDANGRVLIGQFTTDGTVTLNCNIQYRAADGTNPQAVDLTLVFPNNCPEDINGDGLVAVDDILTLLSSFGCTGPSCVGDLDGDDVVGVNDILSVLSAFSTSCF